MRRKGVILGICLLILALLILDWYGLFCCDNSDDQGKEEYRQFMHNLTENMEAVQRKRHAEAN